MFQVKNTDLESKYSGYSQVLVYCTNGYRSGIAVSWLRARGVTATDLKGGFEEVQNLNRDLIARGTKVLHEADDTNKNNASGNGK